MVALAVGAMGRGVATGGAVGAMGAVEGGWGVGTVYFAIAPVGEMTSCDPAKLTRL